MVNEMKTKTDVETLLKNAGSKLVVIDFFAVWCGPCEEIKPFFVELGKKYPNVVFAKVDVDNAELESVIATYEVNCMPTFVFIKSGKVIHRVEGADREELESAIKSHS